jgi:hypothetical protein
MKAANMTKQEKVAQQKVQKQFKKCAIEISRRKFANQKTPRELGGEGFSFVSDSHYDSPEQVAKRKIIRKGLDQQNFEAVIS